MRADTEPMNNKNNKIIVLASFLEFAISAGLYMLMALLNIDLYTFNVYCSVKGQGKKRNTVHQTWNFEKDLCTDAFT